MLTMKANIANRDNSSQLAVTLDAAISSSPSYSENMGGKVELVEGSAPQFSFDTQCLLQRRLRAAAMILFIGFGLFFVRRLFVETPLAGFHLAVVAMLLVLIAALTVIEVVAPGE